MFIEIIFDWFKKYLILLMQYFLSVGLNPKFDNKINLDT